MILKIKIWLYISILKYLYGFGQIKTETIYAQAQHETGNFTSPIFKENNNLFGMREASVRKSFASGTARGHATYKNIFNSVRDYYERQKYFKIDQGNDSGFINTTLSSNYAEDPQYKEKWLQTIQAVKKPFSMTLIALLFFLVVIGFYFLVRSGEENQKVKFQMKKLK